MITYHIGLNAHLLSGRSGYRRAGIHGYIANLLACLPDADPDLRYTAFVGSGEPPPHPQMTVRRTRLPTAHPLARIVWEQLAQPWQLGGLDLLHALAFVSPLLGRRPTVVTVYDLSFLRYPERLPAARRLYLRLFTGLSCRRARRVIAISRSTANDLTALLGVPRPLIDVAQPGVSPDFRPLPADEVVAFRARHGLPERFFLHLGTLEPRKNLPMLLEGYAQLPAATRRAAPLILVGGQGWDGGATQATIARLGLGDCTRLAGYVPDADLPLWYNAATALVCPSVYEGWGLPVVEAMACGTPVLVSDTSSLPEAAGDAGLRLPPDDPTAWAAGLRRALEDVEWRAEAVALGRRHAATFTWIETAHATIRSYRRALATVETMA